jgi:hypothetical protein
MSSGSPNNNNSSSPFRVSYSNYVADITGNPKVAARPSATTGIGHHINPLHNPYPNNKIQPAQHTGGMPHYGGGTDKCARCSKTVYVAEKKVGASRSFHLSCFNCRSCNRKLDSTTLSEHKGEIYCKPCYTKQFGVTGTVVVPTEQTQKREPRHPSSGDDIDASGVTNQQIRRQTYLKENVSHDEYGTKQKDQTPPLSPQRNNNIFEQTSPSKTSNGGVNAIVDAKYQRSPSPSQIGDFNANNNRHRSTYVEEDDRSKYIYEGQTMSYGSGASAVVDIPIIDQNKQTHSIIDQFELPNEPPRNHQGSRSPSVKSNDSYQRQISRERSTDPTNEYSHLPTNDNPLPTENYPYSSTYETQRQSSIHSNTSDRGQRQSRESPSSFTNYRNRSPSPTTGYNAPSTTRTPPSSYIQQNDFQISEPPPKYDDRRSPSPQSNDRISSGLADFIAKTNLPGSIPSNNESKNSTLGALVGGFRQYSNPNDELDD